MATLQSLKKKNSAPIFHEVLSDKMLVALTRPRCLYVKNLLVTVFCVLFGAYVGEGATLLGFKQEDAQRRLRGMCWCKKELSVC